MAKLRRLLRRDVETIDRAVGRRMGVQLLPVQERQNYYAYMDGLARGSYHLNNYFLRQMEPQINRLGEMGKLWPTTRGDADKILADVKRRTPKDVEEVRGWINERFAAGAKAAGRR